MRHDESRKQEEWKVIPNTQNRYEISNYGRVRSVERVIHYPNGYNKYHPAKILKLTNDYYGYPMLNIRNNGKFVTYKVHRLVAQMFIPNPQNKKEVNHKNGVKEDNYVENLEWVTSRENKIHAIKMGLSNPVANLRYDNIPKGKDRKSSKTVIVYFDGKEIARYTPVYEACPHGFPHTMIYKSMKRNKPYKGHYTFKTIDNETYRK